MRFVNHKKKILCSNPVNEHEKLSKRNNQERVAIPLTTSAEVKQEIMKY